MKLQLLYESVIAVDLDGTLAVDDGFKGIEHIGEPIPPMVARVKEWLSQGKIVKILTARAVNKAAIPYIKDWCKEHLGQVIPVTNEKDPDMIEIWDDRAIAVEKNTGKIIGIQGNSTKKQSKSRKSN